MWGGLKKYALRGLIGASQRAAYGSVSWLSSQVTTTDRASDPEVAWIVTCETISVELPEWSLGFRRHSRTRTGGLNCSLEIQNIALVMFLLLLCHPLPAGRCIASLPHVGSITAQIGIPHSRNRQRQFVKCQ